MIDSRTGAFLPSTRVIKYRTAVTIIAVLVIIGAYTGGANNIDKVAELATSNKVTAAIAEVESVIEEDDEAAEKKLRFRSALKAVIIFTCAGLTVFIMSWLQFPVSANQSITGAIIGWGLFHTNYSDPAVLAVNLPQIGKFASTWLLNPLGAGLISFVLVWVVDRFVKNKLLSLSGYDHVIRVGNLIAGAFASYSIGLNSSANVTALYYDAAFSQTGVAANLLTDARVAATIGGIALGVLTYSKKVMMTVGSSIASISQLDGFVVIIGMALTVVIMGKWMGIPVSTSQAVVGAVIGAGLVKGVDNIHFSILGRIALAWISSPTVAGLMTYLVAVVTQYYFLS